MATRFFLDPSNAPTIANNPAFDAGWEQTGQAVRRRMYLTSILPATVALANSSSITIPITTTQDILAYQFISDPLPAMTIDASALVSFCSRFSVAAAAGNASFAMVVKVVSQDGSTSRGTIYSVFGTDANFTTTQSNRGVYGASVSAGLVTNFGDRLVVEVGTHVAAPSSATTYLLRAGWSASATVYDLPRNSSQASADLNPWFEISQDVYPALPQNFQNERTGNGVSSSEATRL